MAGRKKGRIVLIVIVVAFIAFGIVFFDALGSNYPAGVQSDADEILKFIAILAGIILFPILGLVLFVLLIVAFALLVGGTGVLYHFSPFGMDWYSGAPTALVFMGCISFIIFLGIPVFYIGYAICRSFFHVKPLTATAKWILIVLWMLSIILSGVYFYQTGINGWSSLPWNWDNTYYYSF